MSSRLDTAAASAAAPAARSSRGLTVGLFLTVVATAFQATAVATAMPVAARELGALDYYAWSFSLFLIGMLFGTAVAGRSSDRVGPARPLLVGFLLFLVGLVVAGVAQHMVQLVAGRLLQGLGSGAINTAIVVCVAQFYPPERRPMVFTYISAAWVLPAFVGPPAAAWLTEHLSWHWVFFSVVPLALGGGAMMVPSLVSLMRSYRVPARSSDGPGPAPLWAAGVVALAAAALQLAGQRLDWTALGLLAGGVAALVVALPRLMPPCFVQLGRGLPTVIAVRGLLAGAFLGGEVFLPLMLVEQKGVALVLSGAVLTVASLGWMAGSWLQSQTWLKARRDRLITWGCGFVAAGLGSVSLVALVPFLPYWVVGAGWVLSGLGMGLATASTALAVISLSEAGEQGRNASSLNLSDALGSGLLVGLSGTLFAGLHGSAAPALAFGTPLLAMFVVAVLAVAGSLRIGALTEFPCRNTPLDP